ncbi:variably expressed lipoprotein and hemagglutinin (VlhA) family protein [Mycoplasmoides gallisepticum NC96_1596-4-2P]|uniref:FIVAR domain-containing protein n=1 Tax=Mycoplasmoides gallisepticum TaxID=2096 RepID=UPI0002778CFC|nr:FIVAR domain-containing protein [Mycoplasmoides gallisepticum]AFP77902.1 variably expressed lipoprotein and hemagglutinin (VlhA) family protein [Mycoplasmoides gallisepticum NC96_1596-4-2P]AFP78651.1 variably expressed lipoprotein and hemagglutinin (VlhA) family protein [Mycoplasmoides gallisepticum NY01_2001.047-5-1P]
MKRKNILKFVSLLGIGSFVMLAAASCTTPVNPTPNPTPTPNPEPNPIPNPGGGMSGGNTNPGNGGGMDNSAQQLAAAKTALTTLLNTKSEKVGLYSDYAKIKDQLVKAYTAAKEISDKSDATLQEVNNAKTTLETAINVAATSKQTFDSQHASLVTAYKELKTAISNEETTLAAYTQEQFSGIKMHLTALYNAGKELTNKTLETVEGVVLDTQAVVDANTKLREATKEDVLTQQKQNATMLADSFVKQVINKTDIVSTTNMAPQPGNYSFVGYSVDVSGGTGNQNNAPNWNFAKRIVWTNTNNKNRPLANQSENSVPLTDVSWIYSLTGAGAKYTLTFNYYGPKTGYLYFPYKLVKASDEVELQYKLNDADPKAIEFKKSSATQAPAGESETLSSPDQRKPAGSTPSNPERRAAESSADSNPTNQENSQSNQSAPETSAMNETPTVSDINVAKVTLTDLKFGKNKIEFSIPTGVSNKVAPMIGNMYLTSSDTEANRDKIYDDLFGNTSVQQENQTAVTVDLLKGYSLATSFREYIRQFTNLKTSGDMMRTSPTVYLVGLIGGSQGRTDDSGITNIQNSPNVDNDARTFTIYVNAPVSGDYHISGAYLQGSNTARSLKFSTGTSGSNNEVTVTGLMQSNWTTLGHFDTKMTSTTVSPTDTPMNRTLTLNKGLNKIVVSGVNNGDTPFIGNLTFTLESNQTISEQVDPSSATAEKNI